MKALLIVFVAGVLSFSSSAAGDTDLPLAAKNVISTMDRTVSTAQKKAVSDLKIIMKKEAQSGRMEKVTLLNGIIKDLEAEIATPKKAKAACWLRGSRSQVSRVRGEWHALWLDC